MGGLVKLGAYQGVGRGGSNNPCSAFDEMAFLIPTTHHKICCMTFSSSKHHFCDCDKQPPNSCTADEVECCTCELAPSVLFIRFKN